MSKKTWTPIEDIFEFTFKTKSALAKEELSRSSFRYKCIRVTRKFKDGHTVDCPIKTEEEYHNFFAGVTNLNVDYSLNFHIDDPRVEKDGVEFYPTIHFYENKYYY